MDDEEQESQMKKKKRKRTKALGKDTIRATEEELRAEDILLVDPQQPSGALIRRGQTPGLPEPSTSGTR